MPDLYYYPESITRFSAVDMCLFLRFTYEGDDFYLPFFAYMVEFTAAESFGYHLDEDCILALNEQAPHSFRVLMRLAKKHGRLEDLSTLDDLFDMEKMENMQSLLGPMKKLRSVEEAHDEMLACHFEGISLTEGDIPHDREGMVRDMKEQLAPHFPHLDPSFLNPFPHTFL